MSEKLKNLIEEIEKLEKTLEEELHHVKDDAILSIKDGKISFTKDILKIHLSLRKQILKTIFESNFLFVLSSPIIYSMVIPAFVLDVFCCFFQAICFPIYHIPKVSRKDFIRMDRHKLAYLNGIEKFNCDFCAYFNGTLAFAREIGSRTEQYWCPIRHALATKGTHARYHRFLEFGDAEAYHAKLLQLRNNLKTEKKTPDEKSVSKTN